MLILLNILNSNTYEFPCITIITILICTKKKCFKKNCAMHRPITSYLKIFVGSRLQLIGFMCFGEPVPHGLSARPRVWAGPTKG